MTESVAVHKMKLQRGHSHLPNSYTRRNKYSRTYEAKVAELNQRLYIPGPVWLLYPD
jgi:hypothetical protein